ncbi:hypothetical protein MLD38_003861 [Melastoma candidum]|uniref:Uncharacterized protein n=1 Tax=Melastoma candidum TaxID=119954 RepID=A0ACB9S3S1_9MYRT|nr:hypothetical protein MLD38_003861 [Melastoma candidum]
MSLSISLDISSSAEKFYNQWRTQAHLLPGISGSIHSVEVHEGDWDSDGAVKLWTYTLEGKSRTAKDKVSFDDEDKSVTMDIIEGDVLKEFKSFKIVMKASAKADGKSRVIWSYDFEKISESVALPVSYLIIYEKLTREVESHHGAE